MTPSKTQSTKRPIPTFASREEEAEFWDTHDLTDYFDDFEYKPSWFHVERPLSEPVTLQIDTETMEVVRAVAEEQGFPPDLLLYLWIVERRDAERQRRGAPVEASNDNSRSDDTPRDGAPPEATA